VSTDSEDSRLSSRRLADLRPSAERQKTLPILHFPSEMRLRLQELLGDRTVLDPKQTFEVNRVHRSLALVVVIRRRDNLFDTPLSSPSMR
jgi:hypothetical protein